MPSSTSSSEVTPRGPALTFFDPEHVERPVPEVCWRRIFLGAVIMTLMLFVGWEFYWRSQGYIVGDYNNTSDLWAQERRKATADATVLIGSSRIFFDIDLDVWEEIAGVRPVQLALEGTSPQPVLEMLADDELFHGTVVVGVTNGLMFSGYQYRGDVIKAYKTQSIARRIGHNLWKPVDSGFASMDEMTRPKVMLFHAVFPVRDGMEQRVEPLKLSIMEVDRNTEVWQRVIDDEAYRERAKEAWAVGLRPRIEAIRNPKPEDAAKNEEEMNRFKEGMDKIIEDVSANVKKIRARGGDVVFAQMPYDGMYADLEDVMFPKAQAFDRLAAASNSVGVSFKDHEELQGFYLPEWSHLAPRDAEEFTRRFAPILYKAMEEKRAATSQDD